MYSFSSDGEDDERTTPTRAGPSHPRGPSDRTAPTGGDATRYESFGFDMDEEEEDDVAQGSSARRIARSRDPASRSASVTSESAFGDLPSRVGGRNSTRSPGLAPLASRTPFPSDPTLADIAAGSDLVRGPPRRAPAIDRLQQLWVQERCSPELLSWTASPTSGGARCDEVVDEVCAQLEQQVSILNLLATDESTSEEEHLRLSLVQLDVERSKWLLRAFLRTRIHKIELHSAYYSSLLTSSAATLETLLSPLESAYLDKYTSLRTSHLSASVLDYLPESLRSLADGEPDDDGAATKGSMITRPNMEAPVLIRCREDCGGITMEDGETASLSEGSIHILSYHNVRHLVRQGRVELI